MHHYRRLNTIDEGSYGVVHRAEDRESGRVVALKRIKVDGRAGADTFPVTSLREINALFSVRHPNVVELVEVVVDPETDDVFMVMEYMDHDMRMLLRQLQAKTRTFRQAEVKCLMLQLLRAVEALHGRWLLHRDLKTSNLLFDNRGVLKVADFGLARRYGSPLGNYTELVVTLAYRAPELLLGAKTYGPAVDMWSVGCIFAELLTNKTLLPGRGELDQLRLIFEMFGTPTDDTWPGFSELPHARTYRFEGREGGGLERLLPAQSYTGGPYLSAAGLDLLSGLLSMDPARRLTAAEALCHPWFDEAPAACEPWAMSRFRSLNEDKRARQEAIDRTPVEEALQRAAAAAAEPK